VDYRHAHATLACSPSHGRDRTGLSRPLQIVSGPDRCAFPDGRALCGTQCATGEAGLTGRRLAVVETLASGSARQYADDVAQRLAHGAPTRLASARESPAVRIGVGVTPSECATGPPVRRRRLGQTHGEALRNGIDATATRTAERIVKMLALPFISPREEYSPEVGCRLDY